MATSSSSGVVIKNQVFISFRGDTRKNFTSHLYAALYRKRIQAYIDEEDLERGDEISPALLKAIEESLISIVVFSKEYASSRWCLDELVHILKCKKERGQIVLPIFYGVDPSDIRRQKRSYGDAFAPHENLLGHDSIKVKDWRDALTAAANLSGFHSQQYENESKLIEKIVEDVLKKLETLLKAGRLPGGMVFANHSGKPVEYIPGPSIEDQTTASRNLAELMNILNDDRFRRIGVWGMGGVGKTTLVKNLNNKLNSASSNQPFSIVIWATVSKDLDIKRLQKQIGQRLNLEVGMDNSIERTAGQLYQRLKKEKFLLILDDVWEIIDLDCLGIPQSEAHKGSKIILTSRFINVCGQMMTDVEVKVNILSEEEAWQLFSQKAGEVTSLEHIASIAKDVARECCGLPMALITVGPAMRKKTMLELWRHALKELRRSTPCIRVVENQVYNSLKLSFDSLEGNNVKSCFLYCALYPEDFSIEVSELIQCWLAEDLIDERQNFEELVNDGVFVVETLKDACLLEDGSHDGTVKMHDVVRDIAIWIGSSLEDGCKYLVRSGTGLREISEVDFPGNSFKKVSFVNNKISKLPSCEIQQCSKASTLLLQGNYQLKNVPDMFLQGFQELKVLNISRSSIESLPPLQPGELRAILLQRCSSVEKLPLLGSLRKLQLLDLCGTRIRKLPREMENLINLRQVNLSHTRHLESIQAGIVSKWTRLEVLDMTLSRYHWHTREEAREGEACFEELLFHESLSRLSITFVERIPCLDPEELLSWVGRMRGLQFTVGYRKCEYLYSTQNDKRKVTINWLPGLNDQWMGWLLISATSLVCIDCPDLNLMIQCLSLARFGHQRNVDSFSALKSLAITSSKCRLPMLSLGGESDVPDLLPSLEELSLKDIDSLQSVSELADSLGLKLSMLKMILVSTCPHMTCLFTCKTLSRKQNLETIKVRSCKKLTMLFRYDIIVPNLRILELRDLKRLRTLCTGTVLWPRLEKLHVFQCHGMFELPLAFKSALNIKEIIGEQKWWRTVCIYGYTKEQQQRMNVLLDGGTREQEAQSKVFKRKTVSSLNPFFKEVVRHYARLFPEEAVQDFASLFPQEAVQDYASLSPQEAVHDYASLFPQEAVQDYISLFPQEVVQHCVSQFPQEAVEYSNNLLAQENVDDYDDFASVFPQDLKKAVQVSPSLFALDLFEKAVQDYASQFPQDLFKEAVQDYASMFREDFNFDDEYSFIRRCYTPGSP